MPDDPRHAPSGGSPAPGRLDAVLVAVMFALCAAVVAGLAWTQPVRTALVLPYAQHGQVSYSASTGPSSPYGTGGIHSGQPVYANLVPGLSIDYRYNLSASAPLVLIGTEQLVATVSDGLGATQSIPLQPKAVHFVGSNFVALGTLDMSKLVTAVDLLAKSAGTSAPTSYTVSVSPSVSARGHLAGRSLKVAFDQPIAFSYTQTSGSVPAALTPPGTGQTGSAAGNNNSAASLPALSTSTAGSLRMPGDAAKNLLPGVNVFTARIVSLAVLLASFLFIWFVGRSILADANSDDERLRIATRHGSSLVEVDALPSSSRTAVVELHSFEGLLRVSRRLECPILHCPNDGVYAVIDNGTLYRYSRVEHEDSASEAHTNGRIKQLASLAAIGGV